jgi:hypothetical protein
LALVSWRTARPAGAGLFATLSLSAICQHVCLAKPHPAPLGLD